MAACHATHRDSNVLNRPRLARLTRISRASGMRYQTGLFRPDPRSESLEGLFCRALKHPYKHPYETGDCQQGSPPGPIHARIALNRCSNSIPVWAKWRRRPPRSMSRRRSSRSARVVRGSPSFAGDASIVFSTAITAGTGPGDGDEVVYRVAPRNPVRAWPLVDGWK